MIELVPIDGSLLVGIGGLICTIAFAFYNLRTRVTRVERDLYGSEKDVTREGLIKEQHEAHLETMQQLAELERRMEENHNELSSGLYKIIEQMDDPPSDVDIYGPFAQRPSTSDSDSDDAQSDD